MRAMARCPVAASALAASTIPSSSAFFPRCPPLGALDSARAPCGRHRHLSGRCHARMSSLAVPSGTGAELHASIVRLQVGLLQGMADLGFAWPIDDWQALSWLTIAVPGLLWYVAFAAPGCLSGLLDYAYAPVHSLSNISFDADEVQVGRQLGQGSFGIVYEGYIGRLNSGVRKKSQEELHVVLKKVKPRSKGASEMHDSEIHMNRRVQRTAPNSCADFLGTTKVTSSQIRGRLSEGLWLVWRFEGDRTLTHYMQQKNFPENVSQLILGRKLSGTSKDDIVEQSNAVIRKITSQILCSLRDLHKTGLVHRDVKPKNLILAIDSGTFKLIDLGAAVDLRSGYNYVPDETIIDPCYAAPERHVMPISTPRLPPDPLCSVVSPLVWLLNSPDRFDLYSVGIVLLQMAVRPLRQDVGLISFNTEFKRVGYNLDVWRKRCRFSREEFALLDADGSAGWELLKSLLQTRHNTDFFIWPSLGSNRPSARAALRHRYLTGSSSRLPRSHKVDVPADPLSLRPDDLTPKLRFDKLPFVSLPLELMKRKSNFNLNNLPSISVPRLGGNSKLETLPKLQNMGSGMDINWKQVSESLTAVTPIATLSAVTLATGWLIMSALRDSGLSSYAVGKTALDFVAISGAVGLTGFVVVRLFVEAQERQSSGNIDLNVGAPLSPALAAIDNGMCIEETMKHDLPTIQEHREQERLESSGLSEAKVVADLAPVQPLAAVEVQSPPQSLKIRELLANKVRTSSLERTDSELTQAVQSMHLQLASLESSIAAGRIFSQHQEHQIAQMEKLLNGRPQEAASAAGQAND